MEKDMMRIFQGRSFSLHTMPIFIGNIFQQFYNMADTVIVGKFVGNAALAAVGACGTLVFPGIFRVTWCSAGGGVWRSRPTSSTVVLRLWPDVAVAAGRRILAITRRP